MTRLRVFPFVRFDPNVLSSALHDIVREPNNWAVLRQDFPNLKSLYGTPRKAYQTVQNRQETAAANPGYLPMVVLVNGRICGVASLMRMALPTSRLDEGAVNFAGWLNPSRPAGERGLGIALMTFMLRIALAAPAFEGRLWTVVRPENMGGMMVCQYPAYPRLRLHKSSQVSDFSALDGVAAPRCLFVSERSINEMRAG